MNALYSSLVRLLRNHQLQRISKECQYGLELGFPLIHLAVGCKVRASCQNKIINNLSNGGLGWIEVITLTMVLIHRRRPGGGLRKNAYQSAYRTWLRDQFL
ncbi:hypothetical protein FGIG_12186 [Fasciola gigantica]|uniref:Uncharacterized protein n=1 Tax=Fasciola gigantica TaxID=46835 RepID=A0A504YF90_FASGI|nr:hypothetical protein FGIG_12186 [Fasciola gigantica]